MKKIKLISNQKDFYTEFQRCCEEYSSIEIYTAWVGNPGNIVPFANLEHLDSVTIYTGISFNQSSPDGIRHLLTKKYKVVIVDSDTTFHPKLYFFKSRSGVALLMGSSNFTYSGFYENKESNILLEGKEYKELISKYLLEVRNEVVRVRTFIPSEKWLTAYDKAYQSRKRTFRKNRVSDEALKEDTQISASSWLGSGDWRTYLGHFGKGIKIHQVEYNEDLDVKVQLLESYTKNLKTPWETSLFDRIEIRRMLLGKSNYGWLGHIGASGRIQQLFSNGKQKEKETIIKAINRIAIMKLPLDYTELKKELIKLAKLGPSIKVWGRVLALIRPDVFCTVSSNYVRESLSTLLKKPKVYFETIDGYIDLLKLIHNSPWYNTRKPNIKREKDIWLRRVAFLDVIFY